MQELLAAAFPIIVVGAAILISITTHEFSHGLAAFLQGDTTARDQGRLTLNPIAHIDPFGTLLLPLILFLVHAPIIGWARPVPFNPANLSNRRFGPLLVGLAGPLSNFCIFLVAGLVLKSINGGLGADNYLMVFLSQLVIINLVLMLFNLIPIPPLDGSKVLFGLLPPRFERLERTLEVYGPFILLGILFIEYTGFPFIGYAIHLSLSFFTRLLGLPLGY